MHWISGSSLLDILPFLNLTSSSGSGCKLPDMNQIIYMFITKSCGHHLGKLQFVNKRSKKRMNGNRKSSSIWHVLQLIWIIIMLLYARHAIINFRMAIIRKSGKCNVYQNTIWFQFRLDILSNIRQNLVLDRFQKMPYGPSLRPQNSAGFPPFLSPCTPLKI